MDEISLLFKIARQQKIYGRAVAFSVLLNGENLSRQRLHKVLNKLIKRNCIVRTGHGEYMISETDDTISLGLCVVKPMDVYEYYSVMTTNLTTIGGR